MSFTFNGAKAQVTLSGGITTTTPVLGSTQTQVNVAATGNGSSQNAYTVTSGKTFYLFGFGVYGGGYNINVYQNDGTTLVGRLRGNGTANEWYPVYAATPIGVYTSGQVVKVTCDNSGVYTLCGVEQ